MYHICSQLYYYFSGTNECLDPNICTIAGSWCKDLENGYKCLCDLGYYETSGFCEKGKTSVLLFIL